MILIEMHTKVTHTMGMVRRDIFLHPSWATVVDDIVSGIEVIIKMENVLILIDMSLGKPHML